MTTTRQRAQATLVCIFLTACGPDAAPAPTDQGDAAPPPVDESACDQNHVGAVERRTRYQQEVVPGGQACVSQEQTRTCDLGNGWSSWSGDHTAETCRVEGSASCDDVPHGSVEVRERYQDRLVPFGSLCKKEFQTRTCSNGSQSSWTGTFEHEACQVNDAMGCWGEPHGTVHTRVMYENPVVPFGQLCKSEEQSRKCTDGAWDLWTGSLAFENCRVEDAMSCGDYPHGYSETRTRFSSSLVPRGEVCVAEEQVRMCSNGTMSEWSGTLAVSECEVEGSRRCGDTDHDQFEGRARYAAPTAPYNGCIMGTQQRLCTDGQFGEWSSEYTFATCVEDPPKSCLTPEGESVPHLAETYRVWYESPYAETCHSALQRYICRNGSPEPHWGRSPGVYYHRGCGGEPSETAAEVGSERCYPNAPRGPECYEYRGAAKTAHVPIGSRCTWVDGKGCPTGGSYRGKCEYSDHATYSYYTPWFNSEEECAKGGGKWVLPEP